MSSRLNEYITADDALGCFREEPGQTTEQTMIVVNLTMGDKWTMGGVGESESYASN
jgi:hypothetical protein